MGFLDNLSSVLGLKPQLERYVVLDFETTGLSPSKDEIIEMAAIRVVNSKVTDTFSQLVKPSKEIPYKVSDITGITNDMLRDAPSINRVLPHFLEFIGNDVLVGHNIIDFDSQFLAIACIRFGLALNNRIVDTLLLAKNAIPSLKNHKLNTVCDFYKIKNKNAHRALSDCEATYKIYEKISKIKPIEIYDIPVPKTIRKFPENSTEDTKKLQKLDDLLAEALMNGTFTAEDIKKTKSWIKRNADLKDQYPVAQLAKALAEISEPDQLFIAVRDLCIPNYVQMGANKPIMIIGKKITVAGEFMFGSHEEVVTELEKRGAMIRANVSSNTDYLVIGKYGSIDWNFKGYGNQFKHAMELIEKGNNIEIISEDNFWRNLR